MRLFYFVGGPTAGHHDAFARRLAEVGGPPRGWQIYPYADGGGQALHLVEADATDAIDAHLANFAPTYQLGPIVELVQKREKEESGMTRAKSQAGRQMAEDPQQPVPRPDRRALPAAARGDSGCDRRVHRRAHERQPLAAEVADETGGAKR